MIEFLEAVLALVGFLALVGVAGLFLAARFGEEPAAPPDPYEQALYRAAWKAHNE